MRGPDGGAAGATVSGRATTGSETGVVCLGGGGDRIGALKLRVLLGPVGALKGCAGPRGGDRG